MSDPIGGGVFEEIVIAQYGEFTAVQDSSSWVSILDGEGTVRLVMEYEVWERFTEDAVRRRMI